MEHPFLSDNFATKNTRLEFNLTTGEYKQEEYGPETSTEFPVVNQNFIGYKTQFVYLAFFEKQIPETQVEKDNMFVRGFYKFDTQSRKVLAKVDLGDTKRGGEVYFQQRDGAKTEDDGYLMTFVYDIQTDSSEFVIWDAKTMDESPVLRA